MASELAEFTLWTVTSNGNLQSLGMLGDRTHGISMKKSAAFHPSGSLLAVVGRGLESTVIEMVRAKNDSGETTTSLDKMGAVRGSFGDDHHEYQDVIYSGNGKFVVLESATTNKTDVVEWESKKKVGTFDRMGPFAVHPGGDIIAAARNDQGGAGVHFFCLAGEA